MTSGGNRSAILEYRNNFYSLLMKFVNQLMSTKCFQFSAVKRVTEVSYTKCGSLCNFSDE